MNDQIQQANDDEDLRNAARLSRLRRVAAILAEDFESFQIVACPKNDGDKVLYHGDGNGGARIAASLLWLQSTGLKVQLA